MWRALVFFGLICLAAFGAAWLANNPETIAVTWAGREYSTSLAVGVVGLVTAAILVSVTLGAIRFVFGMPSMVRRRSRQNRVTKGHAALSRGIVAVAAGDLAAGRRYAGDAERLLKNEPLALLLKAQAAQASGDRDGAEAAFRDMAARPDTRVLGLRGLFLEARRRGDAAAARDHAEEAARLAPAIGWASEAVLEGYSADGDWAAAVGLIERRTSLGLVDRATSRRQRAVLLTADARSREANDPDGALAAAEKAVKLAPDLVPAAALAARFLSRRGDLKRAARVIETAWTAMPHPELAAAYLNLRPGDSATDRLRRAETLARLSSWSAEARFAIARAALEARDMGRAREVLRPLLEEGRPTVRLCLVMAEVESRSGNAGATREWLARAAHAPRDKAWIADGVVSETWAPVSPVSGRLDAFVWDTPPEMLSGPAGPQPSSFEPDPSAEAPAELPAFLGRELAPPKPTPLPEPVPEPATEPAPMPQPRPSAENALSPESKIAQEAGIAPEPKAAAEPLPARQAAPQPVLAAPVAPILPARGAASPSPHSSSPPPPAAAAPSGRQTSATPPKVSAPSEALAPREPVPVRARVSVSGTSSPPRSAPPPTRPPAPASAAGPAAQPPASAARSTHRLAYDPGPPERPRDPAGSPEAADPSGARAPGSAPAPRAGDSQASIRPGAGSPRPHRLAYDRGSDEGTGAAEPPEAEAEKVRGAGPEAPDSPPAPPSEDRGSFRPAGNGAAPTARPHPEPTPVVFPVPRAPDDPGLEGEPDRRQRFRLRV